MRIVLETPEDYKTINSFCEVVLRVGGVRNFTPVLEVREACEDKKGVPVDWDKWMEMNPPQNELPGGKPPLPPKKNTTKKKTKKTTRANRKKQSR